MSKRLTINSGQLTETSVPGTEPITTQEAKDHLKVTAPADDTLIAGLIVAARQHVEFFCGRSFAQHTYRADLSAFHDEMVLPYRPIQSITNIKYFNTDSPQVLTTVELNIYSLYAASIVRNDGSTWPTVATRPNAVQITYVTGYSDQSSPVGVGADFPQAIMQAMYLIIGDLYENREAQFTTGFNIQENRAVNALMNPYRVYL